ncbi:MAG: cytochrome c-type biogenesis protein CcmH [Solirubrobacteraceae bacterium]|nr:cytochrome c-type biogenesis protein CcmH [Solirubrobacteraceae bacterium]
MTRSSAFTRTAAGPRVGRVAHAGGPFDHVAPATDPPRTGARRPLPTTPRRLPLLALLTALLLAVLASPVSAQAPRTTFPEVERELMCVTCGTPLNQSEAPQAEDERDAIERLIARGLTKQQVLDEMVAIYGESVLIDPPSNARTLRWALPAGALVLGLALLLVLVRRWRRRAPTGDAAAAWGDGPASAARVGDGGPATGSDRASASGGSEPGPPSAGSAPPVDAGAPATDRGPHEDGPSADDQRRIDADLERYR